MYENGQGILQDYPRTLMWYNIAAAQDHHQAEISQGLIGHDMSKTELENAEILTKQCIAQKYIGC